MNLRTYLMIKQAAVADEGYLGAGWSKIKDFLSKHKGGLTAGGSAIGGALAGNAISNALGFDDDYGIGAGLGAGGGIAASIYGPKLWALLKGLGKKA